MSYTVIITPAAARQLSDLPGQLDQFVREQLVRLMENPTVLSKPTTILQPRGQLFEFKYDSGGVVVWISVIFRYGQDEQTIHVENIVAQFGSERENGTRKAEPDGSIISNNSRFCWQKDGNTGILDLPVFVLRDIWKPSR